MLPTGTVFRPPLTHESRVINRKVVTNQTSLGGPECYLLGPYLDLP